MSAETKKDKSKGAGVPKTRLDYTDPMFLLEIEGLARDGFDDGQIAEIYDVAPDTFSRNKKKKQIDGSPSLLSLSLSRGRRPLSVLVENSLYKRAMGQTLVTTTTIRKWIVIPGMNNEEPVEVVQETETKTEIPGGELSIQFWLKHHKADVYNVQPERVDVTSAGKAIDQAPRIGKIEHVTISSDQVKKQEVDV